MDTINKFLSNDIKQILKEGDIHTKINKTLAIDFDGVIHKYSKGFHDGTIYDPPQEGVQEALEILSKKYILACYTARVNIGAGGKEEIRLWLKKYDLLKYFSEITGMKIPAIAYIDDNAIQHTDWSSTLFSLKKFGFLDKI